MQSAAVKPLSLATLLLVALACAPLLLAPPMATPFVLAGIGVLAVGLLLIYRGDLMPLLLLWLGLTSVFNEYFWTSGTRGFFNLTIDRIALGGVAFLFVVALLLGRIRFRWPPVLGLVLVGLVGWCAVSAQAAGWTMDAAETAGGVKVAPPYYRFFAGFLFPAMVFFMAAATVRREKQIRTILLFFTLFGVYLTFTGFAEWLDWSKLVWPQYILNPELGIHQERIRGPFLNAPDMGLTMLVCLFANLLLATKVRPQWAILLLLVSLPMPVVIYLTLTRSIWLAFVLCTLLAIWAWTGGKRISDFGFRISDLQKSQGVSLNPKSEIRNPKSPSRAVPWALTLTVVAGMVVATFLLWDRLDTEDRTRGGVAEKAPVENREALAMVSLELAGDHPLTGVGLGRFQEASQRSRTMREFESQAEMYGRGAVEHNNFLSMLAETGIPGAIAYAALLIGLLAVSIRLYRLIPPEASGFLDRRFVGFYWIVWAAFFVNSMFRLTTSSPFPNGMFLLLGGCVVGYYHRLRESRKPLQIAN